MAYKTLVRDLTVPRSVGELTDLFGNKIGDQLQAIVYPNVNTVLEDEDVAPKVRDAVERGDLEGRLEKVSDSALEDARKVAEPFPGYDDLEPEDVVAAFTVLPSATVRAVQVYEADNRNDPSIVDYHIGRGESFNGRLTGNVSPDPLPTEEKEQAKIVTREVKDDDVVFGESPNDDGTPQREPGSLDGDARGEVEKAAPRRGRRSSKAKPAAATTAKSGSDKNE